MSDIFVRGDSNCVKISMACTVVSIAKTVIRREKIVFNCMTLCCLHACMEKLYSVVMPQICIYVGNMRSSPK